jgi:ornithine carbamoyltransferase
MLTFAKTLAKYSPVPVINALSKLYHPTQILADLQTLWENLEPVTYPKFGTSTSQNDVENHLAKIYPLACLKGKKAAWVGDTNNITNELLVTLPRCGMHLAVASPKGYDAVEEVVWKRV